MSRLMIVLFFASVAFAQPKTHQIKLDEHIFTLPEGFTIEKVADRPLVDRPIVASFDDRGRLYVADSSGSNEKVVEQLKNPTHRIVRLEDTDGDGKFDKSTVFADKMMFPEGILWHRGHVYCAAPPHIWKLTDTDDDGKADKREIWFDGKTLTGCANDLHGPYLGPDGWIYWTKGAFAKQEYTLPNGKKFTTRASHIFRARPDGTGIEPVMTGGMDNPVDVAFLPNGERFFTTTFFQHPAAGQRDGLIHAVYGGIYGKDHDVIRDPDHKWTSPNLMPVMTHMGPAAPAGLHCYESDAFGKEFTSNLFACQFNLRKVSRHVLKPKGATYETVDSDFVVSDNTDFHPTDVIEDADGSLLIVNTGGWYKLCCPSSQLVKADVLGAIYRVRRIESKYAFKWLPPIEELEKRIEKKSALNLFSLFDSTRQQIIRDRILDVGFEKDDRFGDSLYISMANRIRARKGDLGEKGIAGIRGGWSEPARIAIWTLCQLDSVRAREITRTAFSHPEETVAIAAIHSAGLWRDSDAVVSLVALLSGKTISGKSPLVRRAATEALGRIGQDMAVAHIMKALAEESNDRALDHSLTYALIELDNREYLKNSLDTKSTRVLRACLTALDQLGEKLDPKIVHEAMKSKDAALKDTALWIVARHPEWADHMATIASKRYGPEMVPVLARFARNPAVEKELLATLTAKWSPENHYPMMHAMYVLASAGGKEMPRSWADAIGNALKYISPDGDISGAAFSALKALPAKAGATVLEQQLREIYSHKAFLDEFRLEAMSVSPGGMMKFSTEEFTLVTKYLDRDRSIRARTLACEVVSKAKLQPVELEGLLTIISKIGPLELDRVLSVFAQTKDDEIGKKLIAALDTPKLRPALRVDGVKERIKHFSPVVHKEAEKLYAALNKDYEQQRTKLDEVAKELATGDVRRGQAVFNSTKASCIACHTIGYVGGKQGPDLTKIGGIRTERDLLEAILFPSASFVRSYEPVIVTTKDQKTFSGIAKKDAPDEMILVIAADKEVRIPRDEIEEVRPGKVSIMPDGLDKQFTKQELADLVAFLRACK